jgi:hypothetical protein
MFLPPYVVSSMTEMVTPVVNYRTQILYENEVKKSILCMI